ncbi:MAG: cytidylate kinase family protein, partial [Clostridia bacterium]|nr:cytidylate kinase family protein [Clostridia bacterium]
MGNIITISREFGSLGRPIAKAVAERMGYRFYDPELIELAAQKLGRNVRDLEAY